jgi:hypothetical protein
MSAVWVADRFRLAKNSIRSVRAAAALLSDFVEQVYE